MSIQVYDYIDVKERASMLGCNAPTGLALLPTNFDTAESKSELTYEDSALTVRKLWRQAGLAETRIEKENERVFYEGKESFDWFAPTMFVGFSLLTNNSDLISVALNVISSYLTDYFKGIQSDKKVKFTIIVEGEQKRFKSIKYEGSVEGMNKLPEVIQEISKL